MQVEFECIVCGREAAATVDEAAVPTDDGPLRTLRDCPACGFETIWVSSAAL